MSKFSVQSTRAMWACQGYPEQPKLEKFSEVLALLSLIHGTITSIHVFVELSWSATEILLSVDVFALRHSFLELLVIVGWVTGCAQEHNIPFVFF